MASGIYKTENGVLRELTSREVKQFIMKQNNRTSQQYQKQYDIFKNKLRAFESYERSHGVKVESQRPVELLYKQAKAMKREGANYKPSIKMQRIQSFTSVSSGKAGQRALQGRLYQQRRSQLYASATSKQFEGLINSNDKAREIANRITDPVQREKALADYANMLHAKIDEMGRVQEQEAIPFGETIGSDDTFEFDIDKYL